MPDLLTNVSNINHPINTNHPVVQGDTQIRNIADPSRVVRTDGKEGSAEQSFGFSTESNYGNFIQNLKEMPELTELFSKLFVTDFQTLVSSGLGESFAEKLSSFLEMMQMNDGQLLAFISAGTASSGKFGGPFFQALRDVLNKTASVELRTGILEFLKHYSDMASSDHLLRNILSEINEMKQYMFKADADELTQLAGRLSFPKEGDNTQLSGRMNEAIQENGRLLKDEVIPFFSSYISRTHDFGRVRNIMTLITLNISRYINGDKETLMQSFEKLFQYGDFRQRLGAVGEENLEHILDRVLSDQKSREENPWTEKFLSLLHSGLGGEGGYESKAVFQNILNAMLLNESVYMPLIHLMIPVHLNGSYLFSEMWIDPDASGGHTEDGDDKPSIRMLIKFDIKDVGFFDVVLNYREGDLDLFIAYPPRLASQEKNIKNGISRLVADRGLSFKTLTLEQGRTPIAITDVFPKIAEGRNCVDVRV